MCDCRKTIENRLLDRYKEQSPKAKNHSVTLAGYTFIYSGDTLIMKGCMEFEMEALFPLKKGREKKKKSRENMLFTYCPFCGVKY